MSTRDVEKRLEKLLREELVRLDEIKSGAETSTFLPSHIYVEPTNICNLTCATCTPHEIKGKPGKLSLKMWKDIVNYLHEISAAPTITLIGRGEPLIHPDLEEIVGYATEKGLHCYLITNGTLLSSERATGLIQAGLKRIQFSLHATTPETYEAMTGKNLFGQVVNNLERFIIINDAFDHPCHVSVFSVLSSINRHEMDEFQAIWEGKVDRVHMHPMFSLHGDSKMAKYLNSETSSPNTVALSGCSVPWRFFTIRWDGAIVPCALDHASKIVIDKIYNEQGMVDLLGAWNSQIYRMLRKAEANGDFECLKELGYDCQNCGALTSRESFNSCRAYIEGFARYFALQFAPIISTHEKVLK